MERKKAQVIMLPTTQDSRIFIHDGKLQSCYDGGASVANDIDWKCQHLYIVSDDKIKEGDWCLFFWDGLNGNLGQIGSEPQRYFPENGHTLNRNLRKIIATTDESLNLAKPSQAFIKKYCEQGGIDKVLVEYSRTMDGTPTYNRVAKTSNNELIISRIELTAEQIISEMGWKWNDTESSARRVAEYCVYKFKAIEEKLYKREEVEDIAAKFFLLGFGKSAEGRNAEILWEGEEQWLKKIFQEHFESIEIFVKENL